jgi:hypothetical protein
MGRTRGKAPAALIASASVRKTTGCLRGDAAQARITVTKPWGGHMRHKLLGARRQWWQNNPELGMAVGWAVICGGLWLAVRLLGVA